MRVKDLKKFLAELPADADERVIAFSTKQIKGLYIVTGAIEGHFYEGEAPEGITNEVILLYNGPRPYTVLAITD